MKSVLPAEAKAQYRDRRTDERYDTDSAYFCRVHDVEAAELMGELADISLGGMQVVSTVPALAGRFYRVRIEPRVSDVEPVSLQARCVWVQLDSTGTCFGMGFQFSAVGADAQHGLERIIELLS